jgi:hypothetical protein
VTSFETWRTGDFRPSSIGRARGEKVRDMLLGIVPELAFTFFFAVVAPADFVVDVVPVVIFTHFFAVLPLTHKPT